MLEWLPSVPYPPPDQPGYWLPVTSTLQWCEEDYYATYYSAEIVNTLTNVLYMWLAYKGVKSCQKNGHDTVFLVGYVGYFLVGIGSFMFHTTLKYPWQLVDELNMIYTTCLMCYASLSHSRSINFQIFLAVFLVLFCAFITAYYHYLQDPAFHQMVYAAMTTWLVFRSAWKMELALRPKWRGKGEGLGSAKHFAALPKEEQSRVNERDKKTLKTMWQMVAFGLTVFLCGFALWAIDNKYCSTLRSWRRDLGLPWGIFLEGHGWWHLMTGVGAYCYLVWGIWLRHVLNGDQDKFELIWPHLYTLPEYVRVSHDKANGYVTNGTNGSTKKLR